MKLYPILILLTYFGLAFGQITEVPEFLRCRWDKPNLTTCIVNIFESIRPLLKSGMPGVVRSLEPLVINKMPPIETTLLGSNTKFEARNIIVSGASDLIIINFEIDAARKEADFMVIIPKLEVDVDYILDSNKLVFAGVHTAGTFSGDFYDVRIEIKADGKAENKHGRNQLTISDVDVNISFGKDSTYHIETTEGGGGVKFLTKLVDIAPKRLILSTMKSTITKAIGQMLKKYLNIILEYVSP